MSLSSTFLPRRLQKRPFVPRPIVTRTTTGSELAGGLVLSGYDLWFLANFVNLGIYNACYAGWLVSLWSWLPRQILCQDSPVEVSIASWPPEEELRYQGRELIAAIPERMILFKGPWKLEAHQDPIHSSRYALWPERSLSREEARRQKAFAVVYVEFANKRQPLRLTIYFV